MVVLPDEADVSDCTAADLVLHAPAIPAETVPLVKAVRMGVALDAPQVHPVITVSVECIQRGGEQRVTNALVQCFRQQVKGDDLAPVSAPVFRF